MILLWPWVTCFRPPCTVKPTRCKRDLSVVVVFCFSACLFVCLFVCFFSSTLIQFLKDRRSFTNIAVCQDLVLTITLYQNKSLQRARASLKRYIKFTRVSKNTALQILYTTSKVPKTKNCELPFPPVRNNIVSLFFQPALQKWLRDVIIYQTSECPFSRTLNGYSSSEYLTIIPRSERE